VCARSRVPAGKPILRAYLLATRAERGTTLRDSWSVVANKNGQVVILFVRLSIVGVGVHPEPADFGKERYYSRETALNWPLAYFAFLPESFLCHFC